MTEISNQQLEQLAAEYKITAQSLDLFVAYAKDAGNWSGMPMIGGNVGGSKEDRGNLTQLKRAQLITTDRSDGCDWIHFEPRGLELADKLGIDTGNYRGDGEKSCPDHGTAKMFRDEFGNAWCEECGRGFGK